MKIKKWLILITVLVCTASAFIAYRATQIPSHFAHQEFLSDHHFDSARLEFVEDLDLFQQRADEALAWRTSAIKEIQRLQERENAGEPLTATDLRYLHEGGEIYLEFRNDLLALAHKHKNLASDSFDLTFAPGESTRLIRDPLNPKKVQSVQLDPTDEKGDLLIKQFKLSLASALVLYDNFLIAIWPYQENDRFRALINFDNKRFLNGLKVITDNYLDSGYRKRVHLAVQYFGVERQWRSDKQGESSDEAHQYLDLVINGSPTYQNAKSENWSSTRSQKLTHWIDHYRDSLSIFKQESMNVVSGLFGNAVGLIETRKGKLFHLSSESLKSLKSKLEPLDILLEKTPFRLTDKLIPGHYGHVALWLGTEEDLREKGLWNDPRIYPFREQIRQGHSVLEALRSGVQISTLKQFMNVDDLAVLRVRNLSPEGSKHHLWLAFDQIGKAYDFNFDVETDKRIVCSELAYVVFPDLSWPLQKAVGRYTISPDNVVQFALDQQEQFEVPLVYHDGLAVNSDGFAALKQLINGEPLNLARSLSSDEL